MNMEAILNTFNKPNEAPGDYLGEDGLLYCGKCCTAKQTRINGKLRFCTCKCRQEEMRDAEERETRKRIEEVRERCLPVNGMHQHTFDEASDAKHIRLARRYVEKWGEMKARNTGLILWGSVGTGKSFTAHCICNALIDKGVSVRLYSAAEIVNRLSDKDKRDETIQKVRTVPLLVIDDVGAERGTPFAREQLCRAIDERAESGLPLIVTTNYTIQEISNGTEPEMQRIFDRLQAMCIPIAVIGESRRRELGAQKLREARALLGL